MKILDKSEFGVQQPNLVFIDPYSSIVSPISVGHIQIWKVLSEFGLVISKFGYFTSIIGFQIPILDDNFPSCPAQTVIVDFVLVLRDYADIMCGV